MLRFIHFFVNRSDSHNPIQSLAHMRLAAYVAAVLPRLSISLSNFEIEVLEKDIIILLANTQIVGLSNYIWSHEKNRKLAHAIHNKYPKILIIVGGPDIVNTELNKWPLGTLFVWGEGEKALAQICRLYIEGCLDFNNLPKFVFSNYFNTKIVIPSEQTDTSIPEEGLILFGDKFLKQIDLKLDFRYPILWESSRGCPFKCGFCGYNQRKRSSQFNIDRVESEIKAIGKMKIPRLFVIDPMFGGYPNRATQLLQLFEKYAPETELMLYFRPEQLTSEIIHMLSRVKVFEVSLGLQTINPAIPDWVRKNNMRRVAHNLLNLRNSKIPWRLEFITGLPGDTPSAFKESMRFGVEMRPTWLFSYWLTCIPGTLINSIKDKQGEKYWVKVGDNNKVIVSNSYTRDEMDWMLVFGTGISSLNNALVQVNMQHGNFYRMEKLVLDAMKNSTVKMMFQRQDMVNSTKYWINRC